MCMGTEQMTCNYGSSQYTYAPAGHVVTGDLSTITDYTLRKLIMKGPSYREQNNINWNLNMKLCREAVMKYRKKWAYNTKVERRVLSNWVNVVMACITDRIAVLRKKYIYTMYVRNRYHTVR